MIDVKFRVSNLGRIAAAEFDIKPLTVFIGKANTNKTWTAYALYGILRSLARPSRFGQFVVPWARCPQLDPAIDAVASRAAEKLINLFNNQAAEPQPFSVEISNAEIREVAHPIGERVRFSFRNDDIALMLAVDPAILANAEASLELPTKQFIDSEKVRSLVITWNKQYWMIAGVLPNGQPIHRFAFVGPTESTNAAFVKEQILPAVRWLASSIFDEAMAFPSERKGLAAIFAIADPTRREMLLTSSLLNQPSLDYLRFLAPFQRAQARPNVSSKALDLLEAEVINGKADFHGTAEPRVFSFTGGQGPVIQINASASFVRSMAGLDLYLRTTPNCDVIVIDEPEMNAHPEAQLKLVELFAILANQGRHIIVTTHSPYFVDHLNNLVRGASLPQEAKNRLASSLKLKDADAFISSDSAAAYLFAEDGKVRDLVTEGVIDVESFAGETDFLGDIYSQILSAEKAGNSE